MSSRQSDYIISTSHHPINLLSLCVSVTRHHDSWSWLGPLQKCFIINEYVVASTCIYMIIKKYITYGSIFALVYWLKLFFNWCWFSSTIHFGETTFKVLRVCLPAAVCRQVTLSQRGGEWSLVIPLDIFQTQERWIKYTNIIMWRWIEVFFPSLYLSVW